MLFKSQVKKVGIPSASQIPLDEIINMSAEGWAEALAKEFPRINTTRETQDRPPVPIPNSAGIQTTTKEAKQIALKNAERTLASIRTMENLSCKSIKKEISPWEDLLSKCNQTRPAPPDYRNREDLPMTYRHAVASLSCRFAVASKLAGDHATLVKCDAFTNIVLDGMSGVWKKFTDFEVEQQ